MSDPINPWAPAPPPMNHVRLQEVLDEAYQMWLRDNPRVLSDREMFAVKRLVGILCKTNQEKVNEYLAETTREPDERV